MHFLGQASWHAPQSTQADGFIIRFLISTLSQVPQPIQIDLSIILGIL